MKRITTVFIALALMFVAGTANKATAQKNQGEVAITVGSGYSFGMAIFKGLTNGALTAGGLEKMNSTPMINGMIDYAVSDGFSLGGAYSFNGFSWADEYRDTLSGVGGADSIVTTAATANLARHNVGMRGLFHFGADETVDMYAGARLGYSIWKAKGSADSSTGNSVSDVGTLPSIFSIQALFGVRKYFTDNIGINFEVGVGNSPYFLAGGVTFKL